MEEEETPTTLPTHDPPYLFTTSASLPSTPLQYPPSLLQQSHQLPQQIVPDIDWMSCLLSSPIRFGEQTPLLPVSTASASVGGSQGDEEEKAGCKDKGKFMSRTKKVSPQKLAFQTRSADDILDDGYRWRKYGQKSVKNSIYPRSYYRCTHHTCNVKKQIQRLSKDTSFVVTTYEGIHNHPSEKLMESLSPLLKQIQFLI